jgi:hypothetical protein
MKVKFLSILFLIALCCSFQSAIAKREDPKEEEVKTQNDDDKAGRIVSDCVKKCKCENTLVNVRKCMKAATEAGLTPSADEISKEFSICAKEKLLAAAARAASGESEFGPNRNMPNMTTRLEDDFLQSKNATDLNLKLWEGFPSNEEKRVSQTDSVGIKLMNFKYQETTPDLSLKLKQNTNCAERKHVNDTSSKQRNVFECQKWCVSKANEDYDLPAVNRRYNATRSGCEFQSRTGQDNCFLRVYCKEGKKQSAYGANFDFVYPKESIGSHKWDKRSRNRNGVVFIGNSHNISGNGVSMDASGHRALVSKPLNLEDGGVVSFWLKDGPDDGGAMCKWDFEKLKKEHMEKQARRNEEKRRAEQCKNRGPKGKGCSGHGSGKYTSKCDKDWYCTKKEGGDRIPFDPTCTCECSSGWVGEKCEIRFATGHCRSVGDPHPNTADGIYYNVYDAGEFKYFEHPDSKTEVHALFRMAHPRIAATAAVAVRVCENKLSEKDRGKCDIISFEAPNCRYSNYKISVSEDGKCNSRGNFYGHRYYTKNTKIHYNGQWQITAPDGTNMYTPGYWRYGWSHHQHGAGGCRNNGRCRSWYGCGNWGGYLNAYLRIRATYDGRSNGICGNFGGSRSRDSNVMFSSRGHRHHSQWSTSYRDKVTVKAEDSFFKCGDTYDVGYRYSPYKFKSMRANQMVSVAQKMAMSTELLAQEFAEDKIMNKDAGEKPMLPRAKAEAKCKSKNKASGGAPMTEEALNNCVQDMMMVNDDSVKKNAVQESEEEIEEAFADAEADEKDEKQELAAERKLFKPSPVDLVLQYCTGSCEREGNWKQMRAFPAKIYSDFITEWREFTAKIPTEAMTKNTRLRWYQKKHSCYCCDVFGIDDIKVVTGGWPIRIVADRAFTLYGDGKKIGQGEWYEPAKDTYRYRVNQKTKIFGVKIEGADEGRMGVLGSIGDSIVTSSSWRCKTGLSKQEEKDFTKPSFDASLWPPAFEEGTNGILPWGERPGIAKSAFWIFSADAYKMKGTTAYCRVDTNNAWHSYSKKHLAASRWSCKSMQNRQSPYVINLNSDTMSMVNVANGEDSRAHFAPKVAISTMRRGYEQQAILLRIKVKKIMEKTVVGEMIKQAMLRIMVTDAGDRQLTVCRNDAAYSAATVTWDTRPRDGDCKSFKADKENDWATIDVTEWMRDWVTDPAKANFGVTLHGRSRDVVSFASHLHADANMRPRLSLSCHGDRVAAEAVFKEKSVALKLSSHKAATHKNVNRKIKVESSTLKRNHAALRK